MSYKTFSSRDISFVFKNQYYIISFLFISNFPKIQKKNTAFYNGFCKSCQKKIQFLVFNKEVKLYIKLDSLG